jgi:hypothetical protein
VRVAHEWFERVDAGMDEEGVALVRNIEEAMSVMTLLVSRTFQIRSSQAEGPPSHEGAG